MKGNGQTLLVVCNGLIMVQHHWKTVGVLLMEPTCLMMARKRKPKKDGSNKGTTD